MKKKLEWRPARPNRAQQATSSVAAALEWRRRAARTTAAAAPRGTAARGAARHGLLTSPAREVARRRISAP